MDPSRLSGSLQVVLFVLATGFALSATFFSDSVVASRPAGRSLLQAKTSCQVNFEFMNYTIMTSQCKGPNYPAGPCCQAFKEFACPYAADINDLTTDCATTMFSYINLYGRYPPGLFANVCKEGKEGLNCTGLNNISAPVTSGGHHVECAVDFESKNYTIITSQCKGPTYPVTPCCTSFKEFACPYADKINDLSTDCATIMFSYINLRGSYPARLFANICKEGKDGLDCNGFVPKSTALGFVPNSTVSGGSNHVGTRLSLYVVIVPVVLVRLLFF